MVRCPPDGLGLKAIMCAQHKGLLCLESHEQVDETFSQFDRELQNSLGVDTVVSQASGALVCLVDVVDLFELRSWQQLSPVLLVGKLLGYRPAPVQPQRQPCSQLLDK